jgi:hypothetical protein
LGRINTVRKEKEHKWHRSLARRAILSIILVGAVLAIGTIGFHLIEGYSYISAFYFVSMLATAEGPATTPVTVLGKIFASVIAFVSVGSVIFALGFIFGPFFARLMHMEEKRIREEERRLSGDVKRYEKDL